MTRLESTWKTLLTIWPRRFRLVQFSNLFPPAYRKQRFVSGSHFLFTCSFSMALPCESLITTPSASKLRIRFQNIFWLNLFYPSSPALSPSLFIMLFCTFPWRSSLPYSSSSSTSSRTLYVKLCFQRSSWLFNTIPPCLLSLGSHYRNLSPHPSRFVWPTIWNTANSNGNYSPLCIFLSTTLTHSVANEFCVTRLCGTQSTGRFTPSSSCKHWMNTPVSVWCND